MRHLYLLLFLMGCASTDPYLDIRYEWQIDRMSDWVLQPERPWTPNESEGRIHLNAGLEWENQIDCPYVEVMFSGPWDWMGIGCAKRWGTARPKKVVGFIETALIHQVDSRTEEFLRTDQKQWQGHNPFAHLRLGLTWANGWRCPHIATGKSLFQGAPFEREDNNPDLYWTNVGCTVRLWGKTGAYSDRYNENY